MPAGPTGWKPVLQIDKKEHAAKSLRALYTRISTLLSGGCRFEHCQQRRPLHIRRGDAFEMSPNTTQFRIHERINEVKPSIQPGEQLVLDLILHRQRDFGAVRPNLREV